MDGWNTRFQYSHPFGDGLFSPCEMVVSRNVTNPELVGGFNLVEKYVQVKLDQIGSFPQFLVWK